MCDIGLSVRGAEEVYFATGDLPENLLGRELIEKKGVKIFVGSENDVLGRFCDLVAASGHDHIVRITCDNYLVQPEVIEALVHQARMDGAGYAYVEPLSHYAGEYIRRDVLLSARTKPSAEGKEHVTWDIRKGNEAHILALPRDFLGLDHTHGPTLDSVDDFIRMKLLERNYPELSHPRCLQALRSIAELRK